MRDISVWKTQSTFHALQLCQPQLHVINFAACNIIHYLYEQGLVLPSPIMTASLTSETSLFSKGTANRNKLSTILGEGGCGKNDKKLTLSHKYKSPSSNWVHPQGNQHILLIVVNQITQLQYAMHITIKYKERFQNRTYSRVSPWFCTFQRCSEN